MDSCLSHGIEQNSKGGEDTEEDEVLIDHGKKLRKQNPVFAEDNDTPKKRSLEQEIDDQITAMKHMQEAKRKKTEVNNNNNAEDFCMLTAPTDMHATLNKLTTARSAHATCSLLL